MNYGTRIKHRRQQIGISAEELANRIGKSRATVYRYENGEIEDMPITILDPLAKALHTTPAYLMGWTDDPNDWGRIGNDEGIYPPNDYEGSYEDYVKFKVNQEQEDLLDDHDETLFEAIRYLESLGCEIIDDPKSDGMTVFTPDGQKINTKEGTLVYNYKIFGSTRPGVKKLTFDSRSSLECTKNKQAINTVAAHLEGKNITPKKLKLIEQYIDALFEDEEDD
jgi:transcriptional regulator with XRE-family HTH domain